MYKLLKEYLYYQIGTPLDIFALWCLLFALLGGLFYAYGKSSGARFRPRPTFTPAEMRGLAVIGLAAVALWLAEAVVLLS